MEENVTVRLCDFHPSESFNCLSMLKSKLREQIEIAFSMKWELVFEITKTDITQTILENILIFGVEVVADRDLLIFGTNTRLNFFDLKTRTLRKTVELEVVIHEIVVDGKYLYLTSGNRLRKYNLNNLLVGMEPEKALVWKTSAKMFDCWGLALHRMNSTKFAFVMDFVNGILVFDSEKGQQIEMQVPQIDLGFGITFTDENEMIISTSDKSAGPVQIYTFNSESNSWLKSREAVRTKIYSSPYGICYERKTKLIFLVDRANRVFVFNKETMELVNEVEIPKEWANNDLYGITIDSKTGYLYLPFTEHSIQIFK